MAGQVRFSSDSGKKDTPLGKNGETLACRFLNQQGYTICATNWRAGRLGEVDIIAVPADSQTLVFIEVKTRRNGRYGTPAESVCPKKQAQIVCLAEYYLAQHPEYADYAVRFDVIAVMLQARPYKWDIQHLENAFTG